MRGLGVCLALGLCLAKPAMGQDADDDAERIADEVKAALPELVFRPAQPWPALKTVAAANSSAHKGMELVYDSVNWLIGVLQPNPLPESLIPDGWMEEPMLLLKSLQENYVQWLQYAQGLVGLGGACVALAVLFTLVFVLYLCCRCCCCGAGEKGKRLADGRWDACKRVLLTALASLAVLAAVFAVASAFVANQFLHSSANRLPAFANLAFDDLRAYRDANNLLVRKLLTEDFGTLNRTLVEAVDASSTALVEGIKETTGAGALDRLAKLSDTAVSVAGRLSALKTSLETVEGSARELQGQLARLFASLRGQLDTCLVRASEESDLCRTAQAIFSAASSLPLDRLTDTGALAAMREKLEEIQALDVEGQVGAARREFQALEASFREEIRGRQSQLRAQLAKYGADLTLAANNATEALSKLRLSDAYIAVEREQTRWLESELYRWIGTLVVVGLTGVAVAAFGLGLFYGWCGKRPSYYEDDCCVRSSANRLFCCGSTLTLLFLVPFMLLTVALFFLGSVSENIVCDPLRRPQERKDVVSYIQKQFREELLQPGARGAPAWLREIEILDILEGCSANQSLYTILDMEERLGVEKLMSGEAVEYEQLLSGLRSLTGDFAVPDSLSGLVSPEAEANLDRLRSLSLAGFPPELVRRVDEMLGAFGMVEKVEGMEARVGTLPAGEGKVMVQGLVRDLKAVAESSARPLQRRLRQLKGNLTALERALPNLAQDVPLWLNDLRNAERRLGSGLGGLVGEVGEAVARRLASYVHSYRRHLRSSLRRRAGDCAQLSAIASASVAVVCDQSLNPLNALWAALGLALLLLVPTTLLANSLRPLYRNTDTYSASSYSSGSSWRESRGRGARVDAYSTQTDHYAAPSGPSQRRRKSKPHGSEYASSNGRSGGRRSYFDEIGSPPPPYLPSSRR